MNHTEPRIAATPSRATIQATSHVFLRVVVCGAAAVGTGPSVVAAGGDGEALGLA